MPLETATTIAGLDAFWPLSSDPVNQGEDHLQLIKSVLKQQFPGSGGEGFASPITATEAEINFLDGVKSNIQDQIDDIITGSSGALDAPAGTIMVFGTYPSPPGWTRLTNVNDAMLRLVSGQPGATGGTMSPTSMSIQHSHTTGGHALSMDELPSHGHTVFANADSSSDITATDHASANYDAGTTGANSYRMKGVTTPTPTMGKTSLIGSDNQHTHGPTGTLIASLTPIYINVNTAVKS